jgi:hypothetical protein
MAFRTRARDLVIAVGLAAYLAVASGCARQGERIVLGTVITVVGVGIAVGSSEDGEGIDSNAASSAGYLMVLAGIVLVVSGIYDGPSQSPAAATPIPPMVPQR